MTQREAFEKWAKDHYVLANREGQYIFKVTANAWNTWQAAQENDPVKKQLVEALESIADECTDMETVAYARAAIAAAKGTV